MAIKLRNRAGKVLFLLIMISLVALTVNALEECQRVTPPGDIPCMLITPYDPDLGCANYTIRYFNSSGDNLANKTMGSLGVTGQCNVTFNYTTAGTYPYNISTGDTGVVLIQPEGRFMAYSAIGIIMIGITVLFGILAMNTKQVYAKIMLSIVTLFMIVSDFFIIARMFEIVNPAETGMVKVFDTFYFIAIQFFWIILLIVVFYTLMITFFWMKNIPLRKRQKREMS